MDRVARASSTAVTGGKASGSRARFTPLHYDLAYRILQYARWSDLEAGSHLRELELANRFQVSRSPIRSALKLLEDRGAVEHAPHHGVFLRVAGRELNPDLVGESGTLDERLYRQVVRDRLSGAIPEVVSVADLGRIYAINRNRLTHLLNHMAGEGLIERMPGQWWRFNPALTSEELYDASYRFRLVVEPASFHEPGFQLDQAEFSELFSVNQRLMDGEVWTASYSDLYQVDATFHATLACWSGNTFLIQAVCHQNRLRRLTEYEYYGDRDRMLTSCREHEAILMAIGNDNREEAADLMRRHIQTSWDSRPPFPDQELVSLS